MSKPLSKDRREVVLISTGVATGSGLAILFAHDHPVVIGVWIVVLLSAAGYAAVKMVKIKRGTR